MVYERHVPLAVVVITHGARKHLGFSLPPILSSPLRPRVLVVNSSSHDGTVERALELGADALVIPRDEFNHGTTRELARHFVNADVVVMMTPDAYPESEGALGLLVEPVSTGEAAVAYGRQLPRDGAGLLEAFPRRFNYPAESHIRDGGDSGRWGVYSIFCSNSWAAWRNDALDEIGGFSPVLTAEDTVAAAQLLAAGRKVAYVAESRVRHSHHYGLAGEFRRYFDTGFERKEQAALIGQAGSDEARGFAFTRALLARVWRQQPLLVPYALAHTGAKYLGYRAGRLGHRLPESWRPRLSGQDYYWRSRVYREGWTPGPGEAHRYQHLLARDRL